MNTDRIRTLIVEKVKTRPAMMKRARKDAKDAPETLTARDLAGLEPWLAHNDLNHYLTACLVPGGYIASGMALHDLRDIRDSTVEGCSPGGYILPFGYLVIASSAGGNELCVGTNGRVYWADHETFADSLTYQHPETGDLEDWEYTLENVRRALIPVSEHFEAFLESLLTDQLDQQLRALD
jgi:hypothetical protein